MQHADNRAADHADMSRGMTAWHRRLQEAMQRDPHAGTSTGVADVDLGGQTPWRGRLNAAPGQPRAFADHVGYSERHLGV